jgi:hypothetical protein
LAGPLSDYKLHKREESRSLLLEQKVDQPLHEFQVPFVRTHGVHRDMDENAADMFVFAEIMQALEVDIVAEVASGVLALDHFEIFAQNFHDLGEIEFAVNGEVERFVFTDLDFGENISIIVWNSEVLVVVATSLKMVDFVRTHSEVNVQNLLSWKFSNFMFDLVDIGINRLNSHLHHITLESRDGLFGEMFRDHFCRVEFVIAEFLESG